VLKQEISSRARLVVVDDQADADLILSGTVLYYGTYAKTSNSVSEPLDYADTLSVAATLVDRTSGKVLWKTRGTTSSTTVPVVSQAIIPTTPQFLQQNLRGKDLLNMPDIQVAATQQSTAKGNLMSAEASELYFGYGLGSLTSHSRIKVRTNTPCDPVRPPAGRPACAHRTCCSARNASRLWGPYRSRSTPAAGC
jgi:hypothetical protein